MIYIEKVINKIFLSAIIILAILFSSIFLMSCGVVSPSNVTSALPTNTTLSSTITSPSPQPTQTTPTPTVPLKTSTTPTQTTPTIKVSTTPTPTPTISYTFEVPITHSPVPFSFSSVLFGESSSLAVNIQSIDRISGMVVVNGGDSRRPSIPFTFNWGDGEITNDFMGASHIYSETDENYVITVTAHYNDQTTDSKEITALFVSPELKPVLLPDEIKVSIPSVPVSLISRMPYVWSSKLTTFEDSHFEAISRPKAEYILSVVALIQMDFANNDVYTTDGGFIQVVLRDPDFGGMYSLWYTSPVSFGASTSAFKGTIQWSSMMHEMGHNISLNSPAGYYFGGKIDGNANAIFSETMAQIFQHATAYELLNTYPTYGLDEDLAASIRESALASMMFVRNSYDLYLSSGKFFASWNNPFTPEDETFNTFMTIAYKFCEHAEKSEEGYKTPLKRMMLFLQNFDQDIKNQYNPGSNTEEAASFRATFMVSALSYAFEKDLRNEFKELNFPISDAVYNELINRVETGN